MAGNPAKATHLHLSLWCDITATLLRRHRDFTETLLLSDRYLILLLFLQLRAYGVGASKGEPFWILSRWEKPVKKLITAALGGTVVATLAFASASALNVDGGTVQYGQDGVTCDADGVKANWGLETDTNDVRSVRISGIDPACAGAEMFIKVDDRPNMKIVLTDAETQSVSFPTPYPAPDSIHGVRIWIEG